MSALERRRQEAVFYVLDRLSMGPWTSVPVRWQRVLQSISDRGLVSRIAPKPACVRRVWMITGDGLAELERLTLTLGADAA